MIIINIIHGLGNQMFQYAMGKALAYRNQHPLKLDIAGFKNHPLRNYVLNVFNIDTETASNDNSNQKTIQIETILNEIEKITYFSIIKNPIQKYKAYKAMLKTYKKLKSFNNRMI